MHNSTIAAAAAAATTITTTTTTTTTTGASFSEFQGYPNLCYKFASIKFPFNTTLLFLYVKLYLDNFVINYLFENCPRNKS